MRLLSKQWTQRSIPVNNDEVVAWVPLPSGAKCNGLWLESHIITDRETEAGGFIYGMSGQIVRKEDPDEQQTYDQEWDVAVAKDFYGAETSTGMFASHDQGELSVDTSPEFEPGHLDVEGLFGGKDLRGSKEFFSRKKFLTLANSGKNYKATDDTFGADTVRYTDLVHTKVRFGFGGRVEGVHTAMVGFSNPDVLNTTSTVPQTPSDQDWMILSFIDEFLDEMLVYALGLSGGNNVDPYQEISYFIARLLEGDVIEESSGAWGQTNYRVFTKATWDITLPGRANMNVLTSG